MYSYYKFRQALNSEVGDSVPTEIGRAYLLLDTAGIRKFSWKWSKQSKEQSSEEIASQMSLTAFKTVAASGKLQKMRMNGSTINCLHFSNNFATNVFR